MRINRVILENYGLYSGRNEFELIPRNRGSVTRPIILIGGMNGAGKTTFLDAVRLALYGKIAVGERLSEKRYQEHLRGLVHRSIGSLVQLDYARVGVEFDFVFRGTRETYYVQRCWNLGNGNGVNESLQVFKRDGTSRDGDYNSWPTLSDLEPEHWQAFVSDVVPERLSQLFFFDGEKIKRIADDISGDYAIADSIKSLLGLDTVGRLKADLTILSAREAKENLVPEDLRALDEVNIKISAIDATIAATALQRGSLETESLGVQGDIERLERQIIEQGGIFTQDRPLKKARQGILEAEIAELQRRIRQECEGLFPLALCPRIANELKEQLKIEEKVRRHELLRAEVNELEQTLLNNLKIDGALTDKTAQREAMRIVKMTVATHMGIFKKEEIETILLRLSEVDAGRVINELHEARNMAMETMRRLCGELEEKERENQELERQIDRAPDQLVLAPVFSDLGIQNQLLGVKRTELKILDEQVSSLRNNLASLYRQKERIEEKSKQNSGVRERQKIVSNAQIALDKYLSRLTELKLEVLCRTVAECFNRLSHKGDLIHAITIDPVTFEVKLHGGDGHSIPREELSSGEKQILAIAILWGLAKTSGRPLPVIVDTPLGRLDSDHRMNLIQNYFPYAGHQVILLSTDTEVDKRLFEVLKPSISHCYHLSYVKEEKRTVPRREYFWKEQANV